MGECTCVEELGEGCSDCKHNNRGYDNAYGITPMGDYVLVETHYEEVERSDAGLVMHADGEKQQRKDRATVLARGPLVKCEMIQQGSRVLYSPYGGKHVVPDRDRLDDESTVLLLLSESEIWAVLS